MEGKVLKPCPQQLAPVFSNMFFHLLQQATLPTCLKSTTNIPLPKSSDITGWTDYRPVDLTPVILKFMWRLMLQQVKAHIPLNFYHHQLAYRSTDEALCIDIYTALSRNEYPQHK